MNKTKITQMTMKIASPMSTTRSMAKNYHLATRDEGDTIMLTPDRTLRVLGVRDDDADQPVLVVEDMPSSGSSAAA